MKSDKNGSGHCALCCCSLQCHIVQSRILLPPSLPACPPSIQPSNWSFCLAAAAAVVYAKWGKIVGNYISSYASRLKAEAAESGVGAVLKSRLSLLAFILKRKWSHIAYTYKVRTMWRIRNAIQWLRGVCVRARPRPLAGKQFASTSFLLLLFFC